MLDQITAHVSFREVDARVEALGLAWSERGEADLSAFLPSDDDPDFLFVLHELIRRDLTERRLRGLSAKLEEYRAQFPALFVESRRVQDLSFEDYRERALNGEVVTPEHYLKLFGVDVREWPQRHVFSPRPNQPRAKHNGYRKPSDWLQVDHAPTQASARPGAALEMMPRAGETVGDFELLHELGRGAFGRVFLARQAHLSGRHVVVKISAQSDEEPHTLAQMQHTNIVPIYSVHSFANLQIVCMPYFGATTLAKIISDLADYVRPLPPSTGRDLLRLLYQSRQPQIEPHLDLSGEAIPHTMIPEAPGNLERLAGMTHVNAALWLSARIADGLAHAHERGILHCDLKPANVLLTNDGQPMLLDFNVAIHSRKPGCSLPARVGGTLPYMAPEHLEALRVGQHGVDASCDLYSLGVILYELLTGVPPFPTHDISGPELLEILRDQRRVLPVPPSRFNATISPAVDSIVRKLLDPDPARRYSHARDLSDDLDRQLTNRPLRFASDRSIVERMRKWRRRNPQTAIAFGVLFLAIFVLVLPVSATVVRQRQILERQRQFGKAEALLTQEQASKDIRAAIVLLSTRTGDRELLNQGLKDGAATVAKYGIGEESDWTTHDMFRLLPEDRQRELRLDLGELLLLMARGEHLRGASGDGESFERALKWNRLAERCFAVDQRPRLLAKQYAELAPPAWGEAVPAVPDNTPATELDLYHEGMELAAQSRYSEALTKLIPFTESRPTHSTAWYVRGVCHAGVGQLPDAAAAFTLCISLHPDYPWSYFQRGLVRIEQSRFAQAERDFSHILEMKPAWTSCLIVSTYYNRAKAREGQRDWAGAEADLNTILAGEKAPTRAYFLRAKIRRAKGNKAGADEDVAAGLARTPTDALSWNSRGFHRMNSDPKGALADFEVALELNPRLREALQNKALILADMLDRPLDAVAVLDRLLVYYPDFVEARAGRGVYLARAGKRERAIKDAQDCLSVDQSPFLLYQITGLYAQLSRNDPDGNDKAEALRFFAQAFRKGFDRFSLIDSDPDLIPLRKDPTFLRLLAGAKSLVPPKPSLK